MKRWASVPGLLPATAVAGNWSALAPEIAAAAIPGILDLLEQLDLR